MANETSGRRDNRVPFRASTKTPNIMMLRRTRFLLIVCGILAFAVLGIKLFNVMIVHHDEYEKMAIDQQVRTTEITASRGAIYDTNGKILAMNASVDTIFISPAEIVKNKEDPQLIARELSEILDVDYDKILAMTKNTDRWYEVVKRKVEPEVSEKVRAFKKENNLTGVKIEPIGFLVIKEGTVRMINVTPPASNTVDRIIDLVPQVMDRVDNFIAKQKDKQ